MRILSIEGDTLKLMVHLPIRLFYCSDCHDFQSVDINVAVDHLVSHIPILASLKRDISMRCRVCNTKIDSSYGHEHPFVATGCDLRRTVLCFITMKIRSSSLAVNVQQPEAPCVSNKTCHETNFPTIHMGYCGHAGAWKK